MKTYRSKAALHYHISNFDDFERLFCGCQDCMVSFYQQLNNIILKKYAEFRSATKVKDRNIVNKLNFLLIICVEQP